MIKINDLTVEEKLKLLTGKSFWKTFDIPRLGLESFLLTDGPHGIRKQLGREDMLGLNKSEEAICYPVAALSACSFNNDLLIEMGRKLGLEANSKGVDIILGPGMNLKRNPLCGRNFEYFSEDSYLSKEVSSSIVKGIESVGSHACIKHFVANNQENYRMNSNSNIDERTLYELYLKNFGDTVKESKPTAVMTSYNMVNGLYMAENKSLLDYMRNVYYFDGLYISDWGGLSSLIPSIKAGLNLEMPGYDKTRTKALYKAYKKGLISDDDLNKAVTPLINVLNNKQPKQTAFTKEEGMSTALEVARESIVLLKNDDKILPLDKHEKLAVIGELAKTTRYQGSGSSKITPYSVESALDILDKDNIDYQFRYGYKDDKLVDDYLDVIKDCDKVLLFMGLPDSYESEGFDRKDMKMPLCQLELIKKIHEVNQNIIVVLACGAPVELPLEYMKGLILTYLGGMMVSRATIDIAYGKVNPSGRLAETWPIKIEDLNMPDFGSLNKEIYYEEGEYIGYKYYHSVHQNVNFPFGYGLSYSDVSYEKMKIENNKVYVLVKNNGEATKEVIELYLENKQEYNFRRLINYKKVFLLGNEEKWVELELKEDNFMMYDINTHSFIKAAGLYEIEIGKSSKDIVLRDTIIKDGEIEYKIPQHQIEFKKKEESKFDKYTLNSTLDDLKYRRLGRFISKIINRKVNALLKENPDMEDMVKAVLKSTPLRQIPMSTGFKFSYRKVCGLIDLLNGHIFKGIIGLLS